MGISTHPKLPITPHILDGIHKSLDFTKSIDVTFWAVCLVAFFSFLRKSNLLAQSWEKFHPQKQLARQNNSFTADGAMISVTWSKTIQFGQRKLSIPLPHIPKSKFCPSCALLLVFKTNPCPFDPCPAFLYHDINGVHLFSYHKFLVKLKSCLSSMGINSSHYSGHSFLRGGGVPPLLLNVGYPQT